MEEVALVLYRSICLVLYLCCQVLLNTAGAQVRSWVRHTTREHTYQCSLIRLHDGTCTGATVLISMSNVHVRVIISILNPTNPNSNPIHLFSS
jgi:hypothetical protein